MTLIPNVLAASTAPSTSAFGALSPPIASTAMVTMLGGWLLLLDFHDFAALVLSAVRAHAMRQLGLMTVGAFGHPGRFQRIVRTAILCPSRRVASFRIRHFGTSKILPRNCGAFKMFSGPSDLGERPTGYRRAHPCSRTAFHCGSRRTLDRSLCNPRGTLAAWASPARFARVKCLPTPSRRLDKSPIELRLHRSPPLLPARWKTPDGRRDRNWCPAEIAALIKAQLSFAFIDLHLFFPRDGRHR